MKNILAENMIRFRTKNLVEQTKVNSSIYGTRFGTYTLQEMSGLINTYNPLSGYIAISDGNEWLANQRAKSLSQFFSKNVSNILGVSYNSEAVKIEEAKVLGPGNENQYVLGTLYAILVKPGRDISTYKYSLKYNFYEIDGVPHILVTKSGMGVPQRIVRINAANEGAKKYVKNYIPNTPNESKLVWQQHNQFRATEYQQALDGYLGIMIPLKSGPGYSKKDGNALYFETPEQLNAMRDFISKYEETKDKFPDGTQSIWTSTMGGGGSYTFGSADAGVKVIELPKDGSDSEFDMKSNTFINPKKTVTIRRTSSDKNAGEGGSTIAGTGTKPETRKIGDFKFDKTMFADNMIGIQNTPELQAKIQEIKKAYDVVVSENKLFKVNSISSIVRGYASSDAATNRTDSGKPDHGWGINWPSEKWITK
jgi:hypothetical protein